MDIALLYFDGCPSWKVADERLRAIAADRPDITVRHHRVDTVEEADRVGFHGSPSILVDGVDVFAGAGAGVGCPAGSTRRRTARPGPRAWTSSGP